MQHDSNSCMEIRLLQKGRGYTILHVVMGWLKPQHFHKGIFFFLIGRTEKLEWAVGGGGAWDVPCRRAMSGFVKHQK